MRAATFALLATSLVLGVTAAPVYERGSDSVALRTGAKAPAPSAAAASTPPPWRKPASDPSPALKRVAQPTPPPWRRDTTAIPQQDDEPAAAATTPVGDAPGW
ncbi:hypothetical protein FB451DRAFT_1532765 [Mycena latifolia]|nr:hypothetical protein FB451DRAFT_1532765 [Mycena latifolia]